MQRISAVCPRAKCFSFIIIKRNNLCDIWEHMVAETAGSIQCLETRFLFVLLFFSSLERRQRVGREGKEMKLRTESILSLLVACV